MVTLANKMSLEKIHGSAVFVYMLVRVRPYLLVDSIRIEFEYDYKHASVSWDLVAHPVTQVIGEQALVDILDLSEVAWTCCFFCFF